MSPNSDSRLKILSFDTSTEVSAVALLEGDRPVANDCSESEARHAETLLPRVQACLTQAGWDRGDVGLVAVGIGPGSFTGLRVGLAAAKGWALATGVPLVGETSHAGVAGPLIAAGHSVVVAVTDAFKGEVFATVFFRQADGRPRRHGEAFHAVPEVAAARIAELCPEGPLVLAGGGVRRYGDALCAPLGGRVTVGPRDADVPCPTTLGRLAHARFGSRGPSDLHALEPIYVRGSDAKLPSTPLKL